MAENKIKWTQQQRTAIKERERDVLVTASAGTGKTAVLSGRAVDIVSDKKNCPDVWSILVLTFTDAAAEQMRMRIGEQLADAYLRSKDEHLRRQLTLLQGADISTIHSFCKRLIAEHFYKLELDPTFGIIDADEQRLLKGQVLEETIDWAWGQENLKDGLEELLGGRDIRQGEGFLGTIIEISEFLDGVVWRDGWYEKAVKLCKDTSGADDATNTKQKKIIEVQLDEAVLRLEQVGRIYERHAEDGSWKEKFMENYAGPVRELANAYHERKWGEFADTINGFKKPRINVPKDVDDDVKEVIRATVKEAYSIIDGIKRLAVLNPEYAARVGIAANRQTLVLIELVRKFEQLYGRAKRAINRLDFADLEKYTLRLLAESESFADELKPSKIATNLRSRYRYVFVDEYQDINPVQKAILDLLADEGNTFVVGDVKQSIYAFRGAEPGIFIRDLKSSSVKPKVKSESRRVDLNWNFRSEKGVLDFVNLVFARLMSEEFGGIEYDEGAMLKYASDEEEVRQIVKADKACVEIHLLDDKIEQEEEQDEQEGQEQGVINARQRQAAMIVKRIRRIVGVDTGKAEFEVYDKQLGINRPVEYRDIVVLMRSLKKRANEYVEVFQLAGVPVSCMETAGYFEATEIRDCLCLLKVLDNPQRDIELAAILRGPIFKVDDNELAKIKLLNIEKNKSFYDCVVNYVEGGRNKQLSEKLKQVIGDVERWRADARMGSIADLLWRVYREKDLLAFYSALPNGRARRANLLKLHERAIQFEGFAVSKGTASLNRFVGFIEQLQDSGVEWAGAEPEDSAANAVRIMSVHKSKGLEFPVVFVAELNGLFNRRDLQKDILLGLDVPIGLLVANRDANVKLDSAAYQVLENQKLATNLTEELRILYVAMTRARERLILTASAKSSKCRMILRKGFEFDETVVPGWQLGRCRSNLEWLLYGLANQKLMHDIFETGIKVEDKGNFDLKLYSGAELIGLSEYVEGLKKSKRPKNARSEGKGKSGLLETVKRNLSWRYEAQEAAFFPAKQSVTQLTHYNDEFIHIDYSRSLQKRPVVILSDDIKKEFTIKGRVVGTAVHLIISSIDLSKEVNIDTVREVVRRLKADGLLSSEAIEYIDIESIAMFFDSDLGRMAVDVNNKVRREWPFTVALPASDLAQDSTIDDTVVVQGIVDMLIETADGLVVVDFKTDHITKEGLAKRAEMYSKQVRFYAMAAEKILKKPVFSKWLYFFSAAEAFEVK